MRWVYTSSIATQVVKLKIIFYAAVLAFVKDSMGHADRLSKPNAGISIRLQNRKNPTAGLRFYGRFSAFIQLRYFFPFVNAARIFCERHQFKVFRIDADSITAKVIQAKGLGHGAVGFFPVPCVREIELSSSMKSCIPIASGCCLHFPAVCFWMLLVMHPLCMALVKVQPGIASNVSRFCERGNGRVFAATTETFSASIGVREISPYAPFVVVLDKERIAAGDQLSGAVVPFGGSNFSATSACAKPFGVWSSRVFGVDGISAMFPRAGPVSAKIPEEFSGDLIRSSGSLCTGWDIPASTHAESGRIGRLIRRFRLGSAGEGPIVAVDEAAFRILTAYPRKRRQDRSTSALTQSRLVGHRWQLCAQNARIDRCSGTIWVLMTPVQQEIFEHGKGDCFRACIASILDLPLADVPNFVESVEMRPVDMAQEWLRSRNVKSVAIRFPHAECLSRSFVGHDPEPVVLMGESHSCHENGDRLRHAVVGVAAGFGFRTIHDPDPNGLGLFGEPDEVLWVLRG